MRTDNVMKSCSRVLAISLAALVIMGSAGNGWAGNDEPVSGTLQPGETSSTAKTPCTADCSCSRTAPH